MTPLCLLMHLPLNCSLSGTLLHNWGVGKGINDSILPAHALSLLLLRVMHATAQSANRQRNLLVMSYDCLDTAHMLLFLRQHNLVKKI